MFARAPTPGRAKTRLAPLLGAEGAAALHARLVEHTLRIAREARFDTLALHGTPANDAFLGACASRHGAVLEAQVAGDLGARMHAAVASALAGHDRVILIGTDCPLLTAQALRRAASALTGDRDAVFVPVEDGGYALIGLRRCDARLFEAMPWSTERVMAETRSRLEALGWRWRELATLWDVDRPQDYERLLASGALAGLQPGDALRNRAPGGTRSGP